MAELATRNTSCLLKINGDNTLGIRPNVSPGIVVGKRRDLHLGPPHFIEVLIPTLIAIGYVCIGTGGCLTILYLVYQFIRLGIALAIFTAADSVHELDYVFPSVSSFGKVHLVFIVSSTVYLIHLIRDWRAQERGSHRSSFIRSLRVWDYMANYFPVQLVLSKEFVEYAKKHTTKPTEQNSFYLPDDRNYLIGFHPHGMLALGAFINFSTEANNIQHTFPNLTAWLTSMNQQFIIPVYRDFVLSLGFIGCTRKGMDYLLDPKKCGQTGNLIVVVVGGAPEMLDSRPGQYVMHVSYRFGFFRMALQSGSPIIPCISFGEQSMYSQVSNSPGSCLRYVQDFLLSAFSIPLPLACARGPVPFRVPVNTVLGAPIECEQTPYPTEEQITKLKERYQNGLQSLYRRYKAFYDPEAADIEFR